VCRACVPRSPLSKEEIELRIAYRSLVGDRPLTEVQRLIVQSALQRGDRRKVRLLLEDWARSGPS